MMLLILKCHSPAGVTQLTLRTGQRGRVGSSEWVELSVADSQLESEHFVVDCRNPPLLVCSPNCQVLQHGQHMAELVLTPGMTFSAGVCQFEVNVSLANEHFEVQPSLIRSATDQRQSEVHGLGHTTAEWWSRLDWDALDCPAGQAQILKQQVSLRAAAELLLGQGQAPLALRLIAQLLPQSQCVGWVAQALNAAAPQPDSESLPVNSGQPYESVQAWIEQPCEELRQKVQVVPVPLSAAEWLAQAVAWTGGSLSPADTPPVPPPKSLCGIACATALQLHHASGRSPLPLEQSVEVGVGLWEKLSLMTPPVLTR